MCIHEEAVCLLVVVHLGMSSRRPISRAAERERQVSMRLLTGTPADVGPGDLPRGEMSRMSGTHVRSTPVMGPPAGTRGLRRSSGTGRNRDGSGAELTGRSSARHYSRTAK